MDTMKLDHDTWDIVLDGSGNMALETGAAAQAQDAASEIKLFRGELYYDTGRGVPYWQQILGYIPRVSLIKAKYTDAASLVPGVVRTTCQIESVRDRHVIGTVYIANEEGQTRIERFLAIA